MAKSDKYIVRPPLSGWRLKLHDIIFEADTPLGKAFDILLILSILISVVVVMLDSVRSIRVDYIEQLHALEWFFTIIFTIEYILRLMSVARPMRYAKSFFGVVDLLAILPTYLAIIFPATHYLAVVRILRVLRIFRILKLAHHLKEASVLMEGLRESRSKITVFLFAVFTLVIICGSLMYVIEGEEHGFTSIPMSIYWAVVTLTTVGYGDMAPQTNLGQTVASLIMVMGYGIIAVPTGIVTVGLTRASRAAQPVSTQACPTCSAQGHESNAKFCKFCGSPL